MSDGLNGNDANKTELWLNSPASPRYSLPSICPKCNSQLKPIYTYLGIFPYIHAGTHLECVNGHEYTFCFPYNRAMCEGYTLFDSKDNTRGYTNRCCPFHVDTKLVPVRLYGDLVFKDGTRKMQLRCPVCFYSERVTFAAEQQH